MVTRTTSGTTVLTSLHGAARGAPQQTDAAESEQTVVDYEDKEERERAGQGLMAPSGTEVCVGDRPTLW